MQCVTLYLSIQRWLWRIWHRLQDLLSLNRYASQGYAVHLIGTIHNRLIWDIVSGRHLKLALKREQLKGEARRYKTSQCSDRIILHRSLSYRSRRQWSQRYQRMLRPKGNLVSKTRSTVSQSSHGTLTGQGWQEMLGLRTKISPMQDQQNSPWCLLTTPTEI